MDFTDYLNNRHILRAGSKQLSEVSIEQYVNRFHNLQRRGIYTDEREVTDEILREIENQYTNGLKHYVIPLRYYIEYLAYLEQVSGEQTEKSELENTAI